MLRTLISVEPETELFDATESLKFNRIDQLNHQAAFSTVLPQRNDVVDRIAVDSLGQFFGPAIGLESQSITRLASLLAGQWVGRVSLITRSPTIAFTEFRNKTEFSDLRIRRMTRKSMDLWDENRNRSMAPSLLKGCAGI